MYEYDLCVCVYGGSEGKRYIFGFRSTKESFKSLNKQPVSRRTCQRKPSVLQARRKARLTTHEPSFLHLQKQVDVLTLFLNSIPSLRCHNLLTAKLKLKQKKSSLSNHSRAEKLLTRLVIQARGFAAVCILSKSFPTLNLITIRNVLFWSNRPSRI